MGSRIWRRSIASPKPCWISFFERALTLAYPSRCALCGLSGSSAICEICGQAFAPRLVEIETLEPGNPLDFRVCALPYTGRCAQAVKRLKYARATSLAAPLAEVVRETAARLGLLGEVRVVPVPIHWTRRFERGFNQAELLAEPLRPDLGTLARIRGGAPQASLTPEERRTHLEGAFRAKRRLEGEAVLLIDDVATTGHTGIECAKALKAAGAERVGLLTLAGASPRPGLLASGDR